MTSDKTEDVLESVKKYSGRGFYDKIRLAQIDEELYQLCKRVTDHKPKIIAEIGTLNGGFHYLTDTSVAVHATYIDLFHDNSQLGVAIDTVAEESWMVTPSQGLLRQGGSWENCPWVQ